MIQMILIKFLWNRFRIKSAPILLEGFYGNKWYLIDHYHKMWELKYTGNIDCPIEITIKEYL